MHKMKCECGRGVWYEQGRLFLPRAIRGDYRINSNKELVVIHVYTPHKCKHYKGEIIG